MESKEINTLLQNTKLPKLLYADEQDSNSSPMALLSYEAVRQLDDPRAAVLDFLESAYQAGANLAGWKVEELTVPSLEEI